MSDKAGSSKAKGKMDSDNEETREQIPFSSPLVPHGVHSQDLSIFHTDYNRYGSRSFEEYIKQQQTEMWVLEQRMKHFQISETSGSSEKKTKEDPEEVRAILENCKKLQKEAHRIQKQLNKPFHMLLDSSSNTKAGELPQSIKYSDDDQKEIPDKTNDKTGEQIPSSSPSAPSGLASEDLSRIHTDYERHVRGSLADYVKQQQEFLLLHKQFNNNFQMLLEASASSEKKIEGDSKGSKSGVFETYYFTDSDAEDEELDLMKELIFGLEISDTNRLIIPYKTASSHFPDLILKEPITNETLLLTDPLGRDWKMTLTYDDDTHSYVITQGLSLYLDHYQVNPPDMIQIYLPRPQLHLNHFHIQHQKKLEQSLFEVKIHRRNRLVIPCDLAVKYFNPSKASPPPDHLQEFPLHLTDHLNKTWEMRFVCFEDEEAYVVVRGWEQYVAHYGLQSKDKIRFFRHNTSPHGNSFIIYHELDLAFASFIYQELDPPLCLQTNLLCELDLTKEDVECGRLKMPGVKIPFDYREKEMVKLTDEYSNDWYMIIVYQSVSREIMILDGWEDIVKKHQLESRDMVRFYVPASPDHSKHFLIKCAKKKRVFKDF